MNRQVAEIAIISICLSSIHLQRPPGECDKTGLALGQFNSKIEYLTSEKLKLVLYQVTCCMIVPEVEAFSSLSMPYTMLMTTFKRACDQKTFSATGVERNCRYEPTIDNIFSATSYDILCEKPVEITAPIFDDWPFPVQHIADEQLWNIKIYKNDVAIVENVIITVYVAICDHHDACITAVSSGRIDVLNRINIINMSSNGQIDNVDHVVILAIVQEDFTDEGRVIFTMTKLNIASYKTTIYLGCGKKNVCNITDKPFVLNARKCNYREQKNKRHFYMSLHCMRCQCANPYSKCNPDSGDKCVSDYCYKIQSKMYPTLVYNRTLKHESCEISCHSGKLSRKCETSDEEAIWGLERNHTCLTVDDVLDKIEDLAGKGQRLTREDMDDIVESLDGVVDKSSSNLTIAGHMLAAVGSVMRIDTLTLTKLNELGIKIDNVKNAVERFSSLMAIPNGHNSSVVSSADVYVGAFELTKTNKKYTSVNVIINFTQSDTNETLTARLGPRVIISSYLMLKLEEEHNTRFQIIAYSNSKLFTNTESAYTDNIVVSIVVDNMPKLITSKTVLSYQIPQRNIGNDAHTCVYWNEKRRIWSTIGMELVSDENGEKLCRASHLSSFSALMDSDAGRRLPERHMEYLSYISYIGCVLSIVGLLFTILIYSFFKRLHDDDFGKILINICVSMLSLNVVFLVGSLGSKSYHLSICRVVAIALHYFLLTTLLWMMIEALNMYQMLIVVFGHRHRWFMHIRLLAGWGMPMAVVGITLIISPNSYYPSNQFCFISQTNRVAFYAAVLAPACIILLVNAYVFIRIFVLIFKTHNVVHRPGVNADAGSLVVSPTQVRGALSVMIILGITWVFGPLAIGPAKVVFAYMFTILNSIQGFLVFLFRCVLNAETNHAWKRFITTGKLERRGTIATVSTQTTIPSATRRNVLTTSTLESTSDVGNGYDSEASDNSTNDLFDTRVCKPVVKRTRDAAVSLNTITEIQPRTSSPFSKKDSVSKFQSKYASSSYGSFSSKSFRISDQRSQRSKPDHMRKNTVASDKEPDRESNNALLLKMAPSWCTNFFAVPKSTARGRELKTYHLDSVHDINLENPDNHI